jgi:hypothetical protein
MQKTTSKKISEKEWDERLRLGKVITREELYKQIQLKTKKVTSK